MKDERTAFSLARVEEIFGQALELPAPERSEFLARACGDDSDLQEDIESLLLAESASVPFFDQLAGDVAAQSMLAIENVARPRLRIGAYGTREILGRGGMGVVYRAERVDGAFDQEVALKLLHLDLISAPTQARFAAERQLLARLDHPNIARLLDGGVTEEGRPFLVMERVEGLHADQYCARSNLDLKSTLNLFLQIIEAVAYLHRNLVVHRDLKPSNVLVTPEGQVKLVDFGIAKMLADDGLDDIASHTITGELLLTPAYAAPEQISNGSVTTATDVFALGAILYRLLTGNPAFPRSRFDALPGSPLQRSDLTASPNERLRRARNGDAHAWPKWSKIDRDLEAICLTALRSEPEHRYPSAEQFGQDLKRYLKGQPVSARGQSRSYLLSRFVRSNWRPLLMALSACVLLVLGLMRERSLRTAAVNAGVLAQREAEKARAVSEFFESLLLSADPEIAKGRDVTVAEVLEQASLRLESDHELRDRPQVEARVRRALGETYLGLSRFPEAVSELRKALDLSGGLGDERDGTLDIVESLALALQASESHAEAERLMRHVVDSRRLRLAPSDPILLRTTGNLATVLWAMERYEEVELLDRQTLERQRATLGSEDDDTLHSMNSLGGTLHQLGRYSDAAQLFSEALEIRLRINGPNHPATLRLRNNLAASLTELGRYDEAEPLLWAVLERRRQVLGIEHRETCTSLQNLGAVLLAQGKTARAKVVLREAMEVRARIFGSDEASGVLSARSLFAMALRDEGKLEQAERILVATLEAQRRLHGVDGTDSVDTALGLATLWIRADEPSDLDLARAEEVLLTLEPYPDRDHRDIRDISPKVLLAFSELELARGSALRALELAQRVGHGSASQWSAHHPVLLDSLSVRVRALLVLDRAEEALPIAEELMAGRIRLLGKTHPKVEKSRALMNALATRQKGLPTRSRR